MRLFALLFALAPALLLGCDSAESDPSGIGDVTLTLIPPPLVDRNQILIRTEKQYGEMCPLGIDVETDRDAVRIEITGDVPASVCATAVGPWSATVRLPDVSVEDYEVVLSKDGETDRYRIARTGDELPLELVGRGSFSRVVPALFPED